MKCKKSDAVCGKIDNALFLETAPEISVYMALQGLVQALYEVNGKKSLDCKIAPDIDTKLLMYNALFARVADLIEATYRFGILRPVIIVIPEEYVYEFSPFVWRWYNWWTDYMNTMSPKQIEDLWRMHTEHDPELFKIRPPGHWIAYRQGAP